MPYNEYDEDDWITI